MAKSKLQRFLPILLSLSGSILLWAAWPTSPLTFLIFIAFIPFLRIADLVPKRGAYYGCIYLSLFMWNVATTWWVGNTTVPVSGLAANLINTTVMTVPLVAYRHTRRRLGVTAGYFALVVYWLTFEYIHLNWEFSWPWLSLGNAFAMHPSWIQWYEYTGASGGTLWVLLTNIIIYQTWQKRKEYTVPLTTFLWKEGWKPVTVIVIPLLISGLIQFRLKMPEGPSTGVVIVQPNIDPYDKFADDNTAQQLEKLLSLTKKEADSTTSYIIWPETAMFPHGAWENDISYRQETESVRSLLRQYPGSRLITGATTLKRYNSGDELPSTVRRMDDSNTFYDVFNAAIQIDTSNSIQVYHKFKLVPGVEMVPYGRYLKFMAHLALDMGGITGSYGRTPGSVVLDNNTEHIRVFTAICYESVYGEYVAEHVRMGANLLCIITNDGWWGNSEGHRQHLQYARLRAVETRRWVARSANTGISCFIDPAGNIQQPQPYWQEGVIKGNVTSSSILTFYVRYGDLISKGAVFFCILIILYTIYLRLKKRMTNDRFNVHNS